MPKLLETLLCQEGEVKHIYFHQIRFNESYATLYGIAPTVSLQALLDPPKEGQWRCRIIYDQTHIDIEYLPYIRKESKRFKIIHTQIDYALKYLDRSYFDSLKSQYTHTDDIIFIKDSFVTDTTVANIACLINDQWVTPKSPLLKGTTRMRLLEQNELKEADITLDMLKNADSIAMMNALTGFYIVNNPIIEG